MNDEEQPDHDLSAAEEARIRALLAEARHTEPMPDAVVARLDRVIAGLADGDHVAGETPGTVVPLAVRRRRAARMLVAAAAVVVAGVGLGQVLGHGDSGGGAASSSAENQPDPGPVQGQGQGKSLDSGAESSGGAGSGGGAASAPQAGTADDGVVAYKIRPRHFAADTRAVRNDYAELDATAALPLSGERNQDPVCSPGPWGSGRYVPVEYGATPAYLVLRRTSGDSQVADLFLCGGDDPIRSITLPGP